ncbi:MAG: ComEC/Rec2 family competence protein [Bdellovibrionales bacterium]
MGLLDFRMFLEGEWSKQKEHLILWWPICLGLGVSLYYSFQEEPSLYFFFFCAVCLGSASLFFKLRGRLFYLPLFAVFLVFLGITAGGVRSLDVKAPQLTKEYRFADVEGVIRKIEEREGGRRRLLLGDLTIEELSKEQTPRFIQLTMRQKSDVEVGQKISVLASLRPPSAPVMPGGFDFQRFFYFKRIGGTGFTFSSPEVLEENQNVHSTLIDQNLFNISEAMKGEVHVENSDGNAIVQALLTGDRALLKEETWDHLRDSGLSHMLAISGLHVGLFSATVFFIVRLVLSLFPALSLRFSIKKVAAVLGFCAALFYTLLVGASVPTVRACVMTGMFFLAILMDRSPFSVHLLAFAAFLILLLRPESLMSASFQMSFAAVMGLIIFYSSTRAWWVRQYSHASVFRRFFMYFLSVIATTIIATLVTTPFTLYHFQHISVYGVLGNILAVPIMGFVVMPMAVFSYFLLPFDLAQWPLSLMRFGVERIIEISRWVGSLEGASFSMPTMPFVSFCLFVAFGLGLLTVRGRLKVLFLLPLIFGFVFMLSARPADVYLSGDGKIFGVYQEHALFVSNVRKDKFTQKQWHNYLGSHDGVSHAVPVSGCVEGICCDEGACRAEINGRVVSFLKNKYAISEECKASDFLVAPFSVSRKFCSDTPSIDWYDFKSNGAYLMWLTHDGHRVKTVDDRRGRRPWVLSNDE